MLEKMQVSIYPQGGEPNPGWGGGCCSDLRGHNTRQNPRAESGHLGGRGREERTHRPHGLDNPRPFPHRVAQWLLGRLLPEDQGEDKKQKLHAERMDGLPSAPRVWGESERCSWDGLERKPQKDSPFVGASSCAGRQSGGRETDLSSNSASNAGLPNSSPF